MQYRTVNLVSLNPYGKCGQQSKLTTDTQSLVQEDIPQQCEEQGWLSVGVNSYHVTTTDDWISVWKTICCSQARLIDSVFKERNILGYCSNTELIHLFKRSTVKLTSLLSYISLLVFRSITLNRLFRLQSDSGNGAQRVITLTSLARKPNGVIVLPPQQLLCTRIVAVAKSCFQFHIL